MDRKIRVALVDDHALVRSSLAERLEREPDLEIVGTAESADDAIGLAVDVKPDVIILDIEMPGLICFDAARTINSLSPQTKLLFLSGFLSDTYLEQALAVEASGYLTKSDAPERVVTAIREAAHDRVYFSDAVRSRICVDSRGAHLARPSRSRLSALTAREVEVLAYIARGLPKKEIGQIMHISSKTVDQHAQKLMKKLDIHDRVQLARFALREGLSNL